MDYKCPICRNNINHISNILLDNIKIPLKKDCIFCLNEMRKSIEDKEHLVSCPSCGTLFHKNCWTVFISHHNIRNLENNNRYFNNSRIHENSFTNNSRSETQNNDSNRLIQNDNNSTFNRTNRTLFRSNLSLPNLNNPNSTFTPSRSTLNIIREGSNNYNRPQIPRVISNQPSLHSSQRISYYSNSSIFLLSPVLGNRQIFNYSLNRR